MGEGFAAACGVACPLKRASFRAARKGPDHQRRYCMLRRMTPWVLLLLGGTVLGALGYGHLTNQPRDEQPQLYPFELSAAEVQQARARAEANPALSHGRTVFVKVELLPDSRAGTGQRQVTVTHYRYDD